MQLFPLRIGLETGYWDLATNLLLPQLHLINEVPFILWQGSTAFKNRNKDTTQVTLNKCDADIQPLIDLD